MDRDGKILLNQTRLEDEANNYCGKPLPGVKPHTERPVGLKTLPCGGYMRMIRDIAICLLVYVVACSVGTFARATNIEPSANSLVALVLDGLPIMSIVALGTALLWRLSDRLSGVRAFVVSVFAPLAAFVLIGAIISLIPVYLPRFVVLVWLVLLMVSWGWLRIRTRNTTAAN